MAIYWLSKTVRLWASTEPVLITYGPVVGQHWASIDHLWPSSDKIMLALYSFRKWTSTGPIFIGYGPIPTKRYLACTSYKESESVLGQCGSQLTQNWQVLLGQSNTCVQNCIGPVLRANIGPLRQPQMVQYWPQCEMFVGVLYWVCLLTVEPFVKKWTEREKRNK